LISPNRRVGRQENHSNIRGDSSIAKNGFQAFDSDIIVFEPADLYTKYIIPKRGERIPGGARNKHGVTRYFLGDGRPIRPPSAAGVVGLPLIMCRSWAKAALFWRGS